MLTLSDSAVSQTASTPVTLPIQSVMPAIRQAIQNHDKVIVQAAPGAGKSTFLPLDILQSGLIANKIVMLEPRRLAAKSIAHYLASQLGEKVGETIGYRIKGESHAGPQTKLEVVTEGILTRMIQSDPELAGIDLVIFDEFHERNLHADTALAFSLEIQQVLRDDLKIMIMSATLDSEALQKWLPDAAFIESEGRTFPVEIEYKPSKPMVHWLDHAFAQTANAIANEQGSILVFLPGRASIDSLFKRLTEPGNLPKDIAIYPLYGQLDFKQQQAAIRPSINHQRKVVLATNIAETSITIEGIQVVIDSGLERVAKFDLNSGITRLEQGMIAQSSAHQRAGRAGRTQAGKCIRLYSESKFNSQADVPTADILQSDLSTLALELVQWGTRDAAELQWLDTPPQAAVQQAYSLLVQLGLLDKKRALTRLGHFALELGLEPRLAAIVSHANKVQDSTVCSQKALSQDLLSHALLAVALLEEPEKNVFDLQQSAQRWFGNKHQQQKRVTQRIRQLASRLGHQVRLETEMDLGLIVASAYPDRIAKIRSNQHSQYQLSNGQGVSLTEKQDWITWDYLVAIDVLRSTNQSQIIHSAIELDIKELQQQRPDLFSEKTISGWDEKKGQLLVKRQECLGALVLSSQQVNSPDSKTLTKALLSHVQTQGLGVLHFPEDILQKLIRVQCAKQWLPDYEWPDCSDRGLLANLDGWLEPYMTGVTTLKALTKLDWRQLFDAYLGWPLSSQLDDWLPTNLTVPTGNKKTVQYSLDKAPMVSVRIQEMFGALESPKVAQGKVIVTLELLSPAQRPLQITNDLAGFWSGSYQDVQKEMKGRYPKHVWPDDPANHIPTTKTKRHLN